MIISSWYEPKYHRLTYSTEAPKLIPLEDMAYKHEIHKEWLYEYGQLVAIRYTKTIDGVKEWEDVKWIGR